MADIIDLEEYPEDFGDDSGYEGNRGRDNTMTSSISSPDSPTPAQPRLITIKSYTEICIEPAKTSESMTSSARARYSQDDGRKSKPDVQAKQEDTTKKKSKQDSKSTRPKKSSEHSDRAKNPKKNGNGSQPRSWKQTQRTPAQNSAPCWFTAFACCCGINRDYKWYSLKGKGICFLIPMVLVYLVVSFAVLPFLTAAALGAAIFFCSGVVSYLAMASDKVGVSIDDETESSCFRTVYGSWV